MSNFEEIKSKAKDFWNTYGDDIKDCAAAGVFGVICGAIIGTTYNFGYKKGVKDSIVLCETISPEAHIGSKLIQLSVASKK